MLRRYRLKKVIYVIAAIAVLIGFMIFATVSPWVSAPDAGNDIISSSDSVTSEFSYGHGR